MDIGPVGVAMQPSDVSPVGPRGEVPERGVRVVCQLNGRGVLGRAVIEEDLSDSINNLLIDQAAMLKMEPAKVRTQTVFISSIDSDDIRPIVKLEMICPCPIVKYPRGLAIARRNTGRAGDGSISSQVDRSTSLMIDFKDMVCLVNRERNLNRMKTQPSETETASGFIALALIGFVALTFTGVPPLTHTHTSSVPLRQAPITSSAEAPLPSVKTTLSIDPAAAVVS